MKKIFAVVLLCGLLLCCFSPSVYANAPEPNVTGTFDHNPRIAGTMLLVFVSFCLFFTPFTCWLEWLISGFFGLRVSYQKTIFVTNLITQLSMHALEVISMSFVPKFVENSLHWYLLTMLVLEVLVYVSEYLVYCRKMTGVSRKRILLYTVCANTASLLGGLLLTIFII